MIIDGVFGSEAVDSAGERLSIQGIDTSDVEKGTVVLNFEHQGAAAGPSAIVGKVLTVRKIFKESDCENDRQRQYWKDLKIPMLYGTARLFDQSMHSAAKDIAAIIRDCVHNQENLLVRYSVEGVTVTRSGNSLDHTILRAVAVTIRPCNKTSVSGLIEDRDAPEGYTKGPQKNPLEDIAKQHGIITKHEAPEILSNPFVSELSKMDSVGGTDVPPSTLTGQAALQREDLSRKLVHRAKTAIRDYNKDKHGPIKPYLKSQLPEVADKYLDHFAALTTNKPDKNDFLQADTSLFKAQALSVELRQLLCKDEDLNQTPLENLKRKAKPIAQSKFPEVHIPGHGKVKPGIGVIKGAGQDHPPGTKVALLHEHAPCKMLAVPADKMKRGWEKHAFVLNGEPGQDYDAHVSPALASSPAVMVDSALHSHSMSDSPAQQALIHGLNLGSQASIPSHAGKGVTDTTWIKAPNGNHAILKKDFIHKSGYNGAERELAYHNLAHNFFGLGDFVPTTAAFKHPETDVLHTVQEAVPNAEHLSLTTPARTKPILRPMDTKERAANAAWGKFGNPDNMKNAAPWQAPEPTDQQKAYMLHHHSDGSLDKIRAMNAILGNSDRHTGNFLFTGDKGPHIRMIDHGHSFGGWPNIRPDYVNVMNNIVSNQARKSGLAVTDDLYHKQQMHPEALKWLQGLDPDELEHQMAQHGVPEDRIAKARGALERLQDQSESSKIRGRIFKGIDDYKSPTPAIPDTVSDS